MSAKTRVTKGSELRLKNSKAAPAYHGGGLSGFNGPQLPTQAVTCAGWGF